MSDLTLRVLSEAQDPAAFADVFAELPARVRRDPYRPGLPSGAQWKEFLNLPLPLVREFWIAEKNGDPVGRAGASLSPSYPGTGYLGFFEADVQDHDLDAVAGTLVDTGTSWLRDHGVRKVYGPLDFATWFNYRFRVPADASAEEEAEPPFAWEPVNPPDYVRCLAAQGFTEAQRYQSLGFRTHDPALVELVVAATAIAHAEALDRGFTFRSFSGAWLDAELRVLYALSMEAFRDNFLFEPIPFEVFRTLYVAAARPEARLTFFALDAQGREVGFVSAFIDRGYTVVKTIAVRSSFRGQRLSTALMHLVFKDTAARGLRQVISALVKTGSTSEFLAARHAGTSCWRHEYALFEKCL